MQKQSLQAYDRERDFSRERDLSRDDADRERDLSLSLSSFSRDLLLDSDFAFLLSRPPDLDLLLKKRRLKTKILERLTTDIKSLSTCFAGTLISCYPDSDSSCSLLVNETAIGTSTVNDAPFDRHVNLIWTWWVEQD